jgi:hypothetical protein
VDNGRGKEVEDADGVECKFWYDQVHALCISCDKKMIETANLLIYHTFTIYKGYKYLTLIERKK